MKISVNLGFRVKMSLILPIPSSKFLKKGTGERKERGLATSVCSTSRRGAEERVQSKLSGPNDVGVTVRTHEIVAREARKEQELKRLTSLVVHLLLAFTSADAISNDRR